MCLKFAINILKKSELIYKDTFNNFDFKMGNFRFRLSNVYTITTATLYVTLGPNAFKFICEKTKIKTILVSHFLKNIPKIRLYY